MVKRVNLDAPDSLACRCNSALISGTNFKREPRSVSIALAPDERVNSDPAPKVSNTWRQTDSAINQGGGWLRPNHLRVVVVDSNVDVKVHPVKSITHVRMMVEKAIDDISLRQGSAEGSPVNTE